MRRPALLISAGKELFASFFSPAQVKKLGRHFRWERDPSRQLSPAFRRKLSQVQALITTWDSPRFSDDLPAMAPELRIIAHCGGEVKSRFSRSLFEQLNISAAPSPMARSTAELGAAFLLYCARNVDSYRDQLRKRSNQIYEAVHLHGSPDSLIGREVAMIGFGRIGRALVELMRGFDLRWVIYDPYAPSAMAKNYPVRFVGLRELLPAAHVLVLTAALTEETRNLLSRTNLARLPDGATVINIARGGLLDLKALTEEVRRRRLRCAIDVTDPLEPLPVAHPLRRLPGAILTPHIAGSGSGVRHAMADVVIEDLERFFRGKTIVNRVTTSMLERMT